MNEALTELSFGADNAMWRCGRSVRGVEVLKDFEKNFRIWDLGQQVAIVRGYVITMDHKV